MNKRAIQFIINSLMVVCLLLLIIFSKNLMHEILGAAFFILFLSRILLRIKDTKKIIKRSKIYFIFQIIIVVDILAAVISGICISQPLFDFIKITNQSFLRQLHTMSAISGLFLISVNIGLNIKFIQKVFNSIFKKLKPSKTKTIVLRVVIVCFMIYGLYACYAQNIWSQITQSLSGSAVQQNQMFTNGDNDTQKISPPFGDNQTDDNSDDAQSNIPEKPDGTSGDSSQQTPPNDNKGSAPNGPNANNGQSLNKNIFKSLLDYSAIMILIAGATHALVLLAKKSKKQSKVPH
jgi:hypothetical protein